MDYMTEFENVIKEFCIKGRLVSVSPYGEGHINGTYLVDTDETKYILQQIKRVQCGSGLYHTEKGYVFIYSRRNKGWQYSFESNS